MDENTKPADKPKAEPLTYTVPEAADLLGLSRAAAYNAVKAGELPSLKFGGRILISRKVIDRLLDAA